MISHNFFSSIYFYCTLKIEYWSAFHEILLVGQCLAQDVKNDIVEGKVQYSRTKIELAAFTICDFAQLKAQIFPFVVASAVIIVSGFNW